MNLGARRYDSLKIGKGGGGRERREIFYKIIITESSKFNSYLVKSFGCYECTALVDVNKYII